MYRFVFAVCLFASLVSVQSVEAATYYVDSWGGDGPGGNDGYSCQAAQSVFTPKATLTSAVMCLAGGDTLFVRGGTYYESLQFNIPAGTSWNHFTRVAAYNGEVVWLTPWGTNRGLEFAYGQRYIEVDGLNIDGGIGANILYDCVKINSNTPDNVSNHIRIQNAEIKNCFGTGILVTAGFWNPEGGNQFINLKVHTLGKWDYSESAVRGSSGFYIQTADNLIESSEVYDVGSAGIQLSSTVNGAYVSRNIVRFNRIHDIDWPNPPNDRHRGIVLLGGSDSQVYGNVIWSIRGTSPVSSGIEIGEYTYRSVVDSNTVFDGAFYGIRLDTNAEGTVVSNNVVYRNGYGDLADFGSVWTTWSNNLTSDGSAGSGLYTPSATNPSTPGTSGSGGSGGGGGAGPTVSANPATVAPGTAVTASWSGIITPTTNDWVGLYVPGTVDQSLITWMYVSCTQSPAAPAASGSCSFAVPAGVPSGTYEVRLFANGGTGIYTRLATSNSFTVGAGGGGGGAPTISASPETVASGTAVTASWNGIVAPTPNDWLALYVPGTINEGFLSWIYVSCTNTPWQAPSSGSCSVAVPQGLPAGSYEIRLFSNGGTGVYTQLATSNFFLVQ